MQKTPNLSLQGVRVGNENRIQRLNRELRELADDARRARREFEEFAFNRRSRGSRWQQRSEADDRPVGRSAEE